MKLHKYFSFCLILHFTGSTPIDDTDEGITLTRILRDITGRYHPELHGDHAHAHDASIPGALEVVHVHSHTDNVGGVDPESRIGGPGYYLPPPQPYTTPNGYANCGCELKGRCAPDLISLTPVLLKVLKNDVRCGNEYELCCRDDPWPGPIDIFKPMAPCFPVEYCVRPYGSDPYDVNHYGVIGPCLGLGSVRCLDDQLPPPTGPTSIAIPIYDVPPPSPIPAPPTIPLTTVYEPPTIVYEPPVQPPVVYEPPTIVYEPPVQPPVVYEPPTAVYEPPVQPPVVYEPPTTVYEPPVVYEPPPTVTYNPPTETYEPPTVPVDTYEPPTPVDTYEPPTPVELPVPATSYGVPGYENGEGYGRSPYYGGPYGRGYSRFGWYPYSRFGYGGFGFRKRFHLSKGFYG